MIINNNDSIRDFLEVQNDNNNIVLNANNPKLKIGTYNIASGLHNHIQNTQKVGEAIKYLDCDIIGLQEVDNKTIRNNKIDQIKELEKITGMYGYYSNTVTMDESGTYGTAILSKYPFMAVKSIKLFQNNPTEEPRQVLVAKFRVPKFNRPVYFLNVHADWGFDGITRSKQMMDIVSIVTDGLTDDNRALFSDILGSTLILVGDFNDYSDSPSLRILKGWFHELKDLTIDDRSWPSSNPMIGVDHIFSSSSNKWSILSTYLPNKNENNQYINWPMISDHLPVVEELRLDEY